MSRKFSLALAPCLFCLALFASAASKASSEALSVIKVITVAADPDYHQPWQTGPQSLKSGSGAVIPGGRYLIAIQRGYETAQESGRFQVSGATLRLAADTGDISEYQFQVRGNQLSLAGGAAGDFVLTRAQ